MRITSGVLRIAVVVTAAETTRQAKIGLGSPILIILTQSLIIDCTVDFPAHAPSWPVSALAALGGQTRSRA